ncbi:MAG TPA: MMPL family transporter [Solimonas sp.]|nr:MMPL family transporter [Solimonas sp.]
MDRLIAALAARPWRAVIATLVLSVGALLVLVDPVRLEPRLRIDPSIERLLPAKDADRAVFDRVRQLFGETEPVLLAIGFDTVYSAQNIARIEQLTQRLQQFPGVLQVVSLANVPNPQAEGEEIELSSFGAQARLHPERVADFPAQVAANPIYRSSLVSVDGRIAAFVITLDEVDEVAFRAEDYGGRLKALAQEVSGSDQVWITGSAVIKAATVDAILNTLGFTIPAIFILVMVLLFVGFRSVRAVLLATLAISLSMLWTLATAVVLQLPFNLVTAIVPPLVITLALSYAVHLLSEYYEHRHGDSARTRTEQSMRRVGGGLLLSAGTTIAGFLALIPGSLPAIAQFAVLSSLGVLYAVILTLVFLPAVLGLLGPQRQLRPLGEAFFRRKARKLALFDLKWRNWIIGIAILSIPVDLYFASQIRPGTDYIKSFDEAAPVRRDYEAINVAFNGANTLSVLIDTHVNDALTDPQLVRQIESLQAWLREQPEVGSTVSYVDHLKLINRSFNENDPAHYVVPSRAEDIKQLLVFGGSDEIRHVIDSRFRTALLSVRIKVDDSIAIGELVTRMEERLRQMPPPLNGQVTGAPVLATRTVNQIASGQLTSLTIASVVIWAMLALMFTSMRAALLAMLPNLLPVGLYFGILGALKLPLDPTNSLIACIVLGIAVDDTIHFLSRFNADARAKANEKAAVKSALAGVLRPVTFTVASLCLGFLVFTGSELSNQVQFGLLASFTLFVAWFADILLTPALGSKMRIVTLWDILRLDLGQSPQHTIPLLSGLSLRQARVFALMSKMERHAAGVRVIRQGDYARDIYVVVDGTLEVWVERNGDRKTLSTMGRGAVMGEAGYFGQRRTANVEAVTPVRLLRFDSQDLENLRQRYPRIAAMIYRNLNRIQAERLARATAMLQ